MGTDYTTLAPRRSATGVATGTGGVAAIPGHSMPRPDEAMDGDRQDATGRAQESENLESIAVSQ